MVVTRDGDREKGLSISTKLSPVSPVTYMFRIVFMSDHLTYLPYKI